MGDWIKLTAADGHKLDAWRAGDGPLGLVVVQEIFGVNDHIRNVTDRFAEAGFTAIAPALYDRIEPGLETGYAPEDIDKGRALRGQIDNADALKDIAAAAAMLTSEGLRAGVVGYCWGGSLAWLSATRLGDVSAAVGYYGGEIPKTKDETPKAPVMLHFGAEDKGIPLDGVNEVIAAHPDVPIHVYEGAGHGFSCDARASFHPAAHEEALGRTLGFLKDHLG